MSNDLYEPSRPPPVSGHGRGRSTRLNPWSEDGDFAAAELERMARACLQSLEAALQQVQRWRDAGHDLEDIYLRGIVPSARLLGHWWTCDVSDFAQVTIASANLQRLLHRLSPEFCAPGGDQPRGLSVLLATEPQSQHTMGAFMLGEFFRRRGWGVQLLTPHDIEDVLAQLRRDWFDAIGLSVSTGRQLQALRRLMPRLRAESPNDRLCVLVGGPLALTYPQALQDLGVDLVGGDACETVNLLGHLVHDRKN
jgi:methanogenic corrinoid protein MtbC1